MKTLEIYLYKSNGVFEWKFLSFQLSMFLSKIIWIKFYLQIIIWVEMKYEFGIKFKKINTNMYSFSTFSSIKYKIWKILKLLFENIISKINFLNVRTDIKEIFLGNNFLHELLCRIFIVDLSKQINRSYFRQQFRQRCYCLSKFPEKRIKEKISC